MQLNNPVKLLTHSASPRITDYTPDLSQRDVDATIAKALDLYRDVVPLDFKQIESGTADIMITFKSLSNSILPAPLNQCDSN